LQLKPDPLGGAAVAICKAAVFDLGGVLIDWDPRLVYRKILPTNAEVERFLLTVCTLEWDAQQDAGRPLDEGIAELVARFPDQTLLIEAWRDRYAEMALPITDSIELLRELRGRGVPLYALSNWGADEFEAIRHLFPFLKWFSGVLISGRVGLVKPDPKFFGLLVREHRLNPAEVAFIDDLPLNVEAAQQLGFRSILFSSPSGLREDLTRVGLL
jgi:2-haloacid dehalogenase